MDENIRRDVDRRLSNMIGDEGIKVPGLGAIVYRDGAEVYDGFWGNRVLAADGQNLPMTREARFRVASVSKMFVAFTLLQLAEEGRLCLDDDASLYLGFTLRNPHFPHIPITVGMLANHTSSLRDGKIYSIPPEKSVREFFCPTGEYWENGAHFGGADQPPGVYFTYSNLNYGLLGTIIEAVTGERFDRYQKDHILRQLDTGADYVPGNFSRREFEKLGAIYQKKDGLGHWDEFGEWYGKADDYRGIRPPSEMIALQNPYDENARELCSLKNYRPGNNATAFSPTGGLRISAEELSHALEMLLNDGTYRGRQILSPASVALMLGCQWAYDPQQKNGATYGGTLLSYGLGAYRMPGGSTAGLCRNPRIDLVGHTGEAFGLFSALCLRPGRKDGFIYIVNGTAIDLETDGRSRGQIGNNYIWEEMLADALCRFFGEN